MNERYKPKIIPKNEVTPLEQIDADNVEEIENARQQIELIKGSLKELGQEIVKNKPDLVVFLDVSARIFGTPFKKYLSEIMGKESPSVCFYNDQALKQSYLLDEENEDIIEADFEQLRGKKVFFIDETFSVGKGAVALHEAAMEVGADSYYFALSKDPYTEKGLGKKGEHYDTDEETHFAKVKALVDESRIVVYDNPIQNLFSRKSSRIYVQDFQGETLPARIDPPKQKTSTIPNALSFYKPPEGMTMEEYTKAASSRLYAQVGEIKNMIYRALKE